MTIQTFEEIQAWQEARVLFRIIHEQTRTGPFFKDFSLRDQISRATTSIMSNIAEGFERKTTKEFLNFLNYARGSCAEVRSQLYIALDRGYINSEQFDQAYAQAQTCAKLLFGLMRYLTEYELNK